MDDRTTAHKAPSAPDPLVRDVVDRLVRFFQPERVYLFGSAARGDAHEQSDYDFMVVLPDDGRERLALAKEVHEILRGVHGAVDVLVWPREEFDKRMHLRASFPSTVVREGILVYGQGPSQDR